VAGGHVVSGLVPSYDFAPTALDRAGLDTGELDVDSRSLRPVLMGGGEPGDSESAVFCCTGTPWAMVRHGDYKYLSQSDEQVAMLFDLEQGPAECVNLAGDPRYAKVKRDLSERLARRIAKPSLDHGTVTA
jgi:arylsulfatase A-like enzyme